MEKTEEYRCQECNMTFRTFLHLDKHRQHFCIGGNSRDPLLVKNGRSKCTEFQLGNHKWRSERPSQTQTPNLITFREKNENLTRWHRGQDHGGERGQRSWGEEKPQEMPESITLKKVTDEVHKLRLSVEESMASFLAKPLQVPGGEGMTRQWEHTDRARQLAERHSHLLEEIKAHTMRLEDQRAEIEKRLSEVTGYGGTANLEEMILQLQVREERNEDVLQELRGQIETLKCQERPRAHNVYHESNSPKTEEKKQHLVTFNISSGTGSLSEQIRDLRLAYMNAGGTDPVVLAQMHELQVEAHILEQTRPRAEKTVRKKSSKHSVQTLDTELLSIELENQQLEEEILRIQLGRKRHHSEDASTGSKLQKIHWHHMYQVAVLQAEIKKLCRELQKFRKDHGDHRQPPNLSQGVRQTFVRGSLDQNELPSAMFDGYKLDPLENLDPAPYNTMSGFVIFYDLMLGVDPTLRMVQLLSALYSRGQEMGGPTTLPPRPCIPGESLSHISGVPSGNFTILFLKQPAPRVQPSSSVFLVVELQAAGPLDSFGEEGQHLTPLAWSQLQLFDQHNRVRSGYWRLPFRTLPVQACLSTKQFNSVPKVGNMELCLRIVNARDEGMQSLVNVDPANASQYRYPSEMSPQLLMSTENPSLHLTAEEPSSSHFLPLSVHANVMDPPPMEKSRQN